MIRITIDRLAAQGDGQGGGQSGGQSGAQTGGGVFAPFTLPGDVAEGAVVDGRMAAPAIVTEGPHRATPPCRHFGVCGGCALQHAADPFLAGWKRDQVAAALAARGVTGVEIRETITSPARSRRRATFAARRTKKTVQVGFHRRGDNQIEPLSQCELVEPALLAALPAIAEAARIGAARKGAIRATATLSEGGIDLAVEDAKPMDDAIFAGLAALAESHDLARLAWNGEVAALRRPPGQRFGAAAVTPPPGGFLQATAAGEAALLAAIREALGPARRIVDLFAGSGAFTLPLAETAEVHAVEGEAAAVEALLAGWRGAAGLKRVTAEARDLFRRPFLKLDFDPVGAPAFDAAVIDPPRAGAAAQSAVLAADGPPVIATLSCNPATFARDARTLIDGGYRLDWAQPVDQFRWSPHIELAARFVRG